MGQIVEKKNAEIQVAEAQSGSPAHMMLAAMEKGATLEQLEKMMELQERWEKREAEKAFNEALAAFKAEAVEILKSRHVSYENKSGGSTSYKHAELADVVAAVGPALSRHGFAWSWSTDQSGGVISVTCTLKHRMGHSESVTLSATPDASGGKNSIQAIGSTVTYLERYTLKAITGVSEKGDDTDATVYRESIIDEWTAKASAAMDSIELHKVRRDGASVFSKARDRDGYNAFMKAVIDRKEQLEG